MAKNSKFMVGKKYTDHGIGLGGLPTPTVWLICRDKTSNGLFHAEVLPDSGAARRWGLTITKRELPKVTLKDASGN